MQKFKNHLCKKQTIATNRSTWRSNMRYFWKYLHKRHWYCKLCSLRRT